MIQMNKCISNVSVILNTSAGRLPGRWTNHSCPCPLINLLCPLLGLTV